MVCTYNGLLFSLKNKILQCHNMDEAWGHKAKVNKPVIEKQILDDFTYTKYLK